MTTSDKQEQATECVGSLLVHTSDLQELSEVAAPSIMMLQTRKTECVGTMLVDTEDLRELSAVAAPTLQKRATVGTLLVAPEDVATHPTTEDQHYDDHKDHRPEMM